MTTALICIGTYLLLGFFWCSFRAWRLGKHRLAHNGQRASYCEHWACGNMANDTFTWGLNLFFWFAAAPLWGLGWWYDVLIKAPYLRSLPPANSGPGRVVEVNDKSKHDFTLYLFVVTVVIAILVLLLGTVHSTLGSKWFGKLTESLTVKFTPEEVKSVKQSEAERFDSHFIDMYPEGSRYRLAENRQEGGWKSLGWTFDPKSGACEVWKRTDPDTGATIYVRMGTKDGIFVLPPFAPMGAPASK